MTRWQTLQQLFAQAVVLPGNEREAFVERACASDAALADELRQLLANDAAGPEGPVLDQRVQGAIGQAAVAWASETRHALEGQRLGAWRIVSHLADGGMGAVYLAGRADGQY